MTLEGISPIPQSPAPSYKRGSNLKPSNAVDRGLLEHDLESRIGGEVRFDELSRALYATDASVYQIVPAGVVIPKSREDVLHTIAVCRQHGCPITARGGGTSQAGQAIGCGIQLDFSKYLNRLQIFNIDGRWVRVEPGIVLDELNASLRPYGLHLPLDISTSDRATIGGMIANNSSGTRSVIYGKTLDYVLEMTVALADGTVVEFRPFDDLAVAEKCKERSLEGDCYRAVRRLAEEHAAEIEQRFPKIMRRVGGYNLDEFVPRRQAGQGTGDGSSLFNMSRLIVGSEGTLALVLDAKLRLEPLPAVRAVSVVHFHSLLESLEAAPVILEHQPSAIELLDRFILDRTRGKPVYEPLRSFIAGDPAAVLIVEFFGDSRDSLTERIERLEGALEGRGLGYHVHRAIEPLEQGKIWKLRRAALGLSMSERGDSKAISFVEDTAVSAVQLRPYIERFQEILTKHGTQAGFYAHASVGLLHVRPVVNLKTQEGVGKFQRIAEEIADLVLEFGGALSGEHGDGLVRSPFQERMYGSELYGAFCEIKRTFDPEGILNPGKIVYAEPLTQNLRYGAEYVTPDPATAFDFSDYGGLGRAAEQCSGVGECRKVLAGTMCPSYMATREERDSTRGRANALRLAMVQPDGLQLDDGQLQRALDLCLECKACRSECPTGVDMARMKAEWLYRSHRAHGAPVRSRFFARPARFARWGCRLTPASNWLLERRGVRWLAEKLLGVSRHRVLPRFAAQSFERMWSQYQAGLPVHFGARGSIESEPRVVLFADTFMNYFEPEIGLAAGRLLRAAGYSVEVVSPGCCGRPLISQGFLDQAREQARAVVAQLVPLRNAGAKILFCEPSCLSAVRQDVPALLRGNVREQAEEVARSCMLFEEFMEAEWAASRLALRLNPGPTQILLHGHCHQKAMGLLEPSLALLARISNCVVSEPDAGCCGMAGSFGYAREHYEISRRIAERRLVPAIRDRVRGTVVVAPGTSCRTQIRHFAGAEAVHPAIVLSSLLDCS